jgi:uncharacterized repeat protein (TIGR03803 family)
MNKGIQGGLMAAKTRRLIVAVILLVLAGRAFNAGAQTETNLHSFIGSPNDGANPYKVGLVQGSDGNFYGTTGDGGTYSHGTVFRISPSGSCTSLYSFAGPPSDGASPLAGLVQGNDGNFYGTTYTGGTNASSAFAEGTVFRISPSGSETVLYSFGSSPNDGQNPQVSLVQGSDGNFYGTTYTSQGGHGSGTVFRISPGGSFSNLYSFGSSPNDGWQPEAGLVQGSDGNFYGTTIFGGTNPNCNFGCGTVFRISSSGSYTSLYSFGSSPNDGWQPGAGLVQGSDGNFYGTTGGGGGNESGTIFRISPSGSETNLYSFPNLNGVGPSGLLQGSDGDYYGTTTHWTNGPGSVFRISPSGTYISFYSFLNDPDGAYPVAGLVQGSDGNFYGTTVDGGTSTNCGGGCGTVFKLTVPLSPPPYPINQITGIEFSGANIILSTPSIAYETYQLQFSSSMNPTNWVNEGGSITSIGSLLTLTNFGGASQPQGFYRFDITP